MIKIVLLMLCVVFLFLAIVYKKRLSEVNILYQREKASKFSISVKRGKMLEQFLPWVKKLFPYNPEKFRFIGHPIDGILFGKNRIVFMEFKTGESVLKPEQKKIKELVKKKKIEWKEIRLKV